MMVTSVTSETNASIRGTLPVRIAVEKDHVLVATGLANDAGLMNEVHRAALEQVRLSLLNTIDDVRRTKFQNTIRAQAEDPDPDADDILLGD